MDRQQAKELLPIIQAFAEGKTIEFRERGCTLWTESISPIFNFANLEYRIKPEPKYRPFKDVEWVLAGNAEASTIRVDKRKGR